MRSVVDRIKEPGSKSRTSDPPCLNLDLQMGRYCSLPVAGDAVPRRIKKSKLARKVIYPNWLFLHLILAKRKFNIVRLGPFLQLPIQSVFYKFQLYEFGLSIVKFLDLCQQHWTMPVVVFYAPSISSGS